MSGKWILGSKNLKLKNKKKTYLHVVKWNVYNKLVGQDYLIYSIIKINKISKVLTLVFIYLINYYS